MPRFPVQRSTRVPGFVSTPQPNTIEGAPGLRAVADAVTGFAQGVAPGLARAEARQKREQRDDATAAFAKYKLASTMARNDLEKEYTEGGQAKDVQGAYDVKRDQLKAEFLGQLSDDQREIIQDDLDLLDMEYDRAAIDHTSTLNVRAKTDVADILYNNAMMTLETDPTRIESVIHDLERDFEREAGEDSQMGRLLQQRFDKYQKPAMVEVSVQRIIESNDIAKMEYMKSQLQEGRIDIEPEERAALVSKIERGIKSYKRLQDSGVASMVDSAISRASTGDEPTWVPDRLLEGQPELQAKQNFAREMFYYGEELSYDSSLEVMDKQEILNAKVGGLRDADISNQEYIAEDRKLRAQQMAIDRHLQSVRDNPYGVAVHQNPALGEVQRDAIAADTPEQWQKFFNMADAAQDEITAGVRNEDGTMVRNKYLGDQLAKAWGQNIASLPSIPEQQQLIRQYMGNMPDGKLGAVKEEILAANPAARDAFVLFNATPGLIDAYLAGRTLEAEGNKRYGDNAKQYDSTMTKVQNELTAEYGVSINTSSKDYTEKERIARMITVASLTDPKAQDNIESGWFGTNDVGGTYRAVFKSLMADTTINGYTYVPQGVKEKYPALALQPEYGQPLPVDIDLTEAMIDWVKRDGGSMEIAGLAPDETWEDALYKDGIVPTLIPRYDSKLGGYVFEVEGSDFRINKNGKTFVLEPGEYAAMRGTAKTRGATFTEGDVRRQTRSEREAEYRTIDNFIKYFGGEPPKRDPNAAKIPKGFGLWE